MFLSEVKVVSVGGMGPIRFRVSGMSSPIIGLLSRASYIHIMNITQLLLSGGSIQGIWVKEKCCNPHR